MATSLTSAEQAKLEHSLALAHRHVWGCAQLYALRDDSDTADDMTHIGNALYHLLEAELKRGKPLRTRINGRAYPSAS